MQQSDNPEVLRAVINQLQEEMLLLKAQLKEAQRDELTKLPKRGELIEAAENALNRGHLPTSMIFLDLNGFKEINDTLGHDAGDSLLIQFAQLLRDYREEQGMNAVLITLARLGGDEFAILLTHTGNEGAKDFVAELKSILSKRTFSMNGKQATLFSAMGVATTGPGISTVQELLHHADKAMYEDKRRMAKNGETTKLF